MIVKASELVPGDQFTYGGVVVTMLREPEPTEDRFGREMFRFWARREDTQAEGWMIFGPLGVYDK